MDKIFQKNRLFTACVIFLQAKSKTIEDIIKSNKEALNSESKSSAGDKHETGRAILHLEMEKAGQQFKEIQKMKLLIEKIDVSTVSLKGSLGSVVKTETATYFLGISLGKIQIDKEFYYVISPSSPIGKLLLGKTSGDIFVFQNNTHTITEVF